VPITGAQKDALWTKRTVFSFKPASLHIDHYWLLSFHF